MKKLRNYWDFLSSNGQTYQMGAQSHRVYLLDLLAKLQVTTLFDVGCGTGPIYQLIKENEVESHKNEHPPTWNFKYKGTDYSEGMIEVCKKEFPEGDWEVQDARKLKEKDNSWDCVLLMHCLDHLDDYESAVKEAARVSKKYVLIVLWRGINYAPGGLNNLNNRNKYGREEGDGEWEDTHLQDYAWGPLNKAFINAGLTILEKNEGNEINKEGKYNTLILLEK